MTELDEPLVAKACAGDRDALRSIVSGLEKPVFQLCFRMLGDVDDAQDATQDILIRVITHLGSFQGRSALWTWVYRVSVRHVMHMQRRGRRQPSLSPERLATLIERGLAHGAETAPPSAETQVLENEVRLSCTQGMLMTLSAEERMALVLVELVGLNAAQAAEIVESTHGAFRQRLSRARRRLSEFLRENCGLENPQAPCRCRRQIAAKTRHHGGLKPRLTVLSCGDLPRRSETEIAATELHRVRSIAGVFGPDGDIGAPAQLRHALERALPTILGG